MLATRLYIYVYALLILIFMLGYTLWNTSKRTPTMWIFVSAILCNIAVLIFEGSTWIIMNYTDVWAVHLNFIINTILYSINLLPMISIFLYFDYRVIDEKLARKRRRILYAFLVVIMWGLNISNYWTGILFKISDANVYSRGPGMYYTIVIALSVLLFYGISMLRHMRTIEGRLLGVMFSFTIMPIIGAIIQAYFYGVPAMWTMFTLLYLFIFIFIEREDMMKDTLTNLVTRGQFEQRLKNKLKKAKAFSLIMIDIDKFKMINDTYGHKEGDMALVVVANVLKNSVKHIDLTSRYGGDEFMLLLESSDEGTSRYVIDRVNANLSAYNNKSVKPYKIKLSMGAYFIEEPQKVSYADVLAVVDKNMYEMKNKKQIIY